MFEKIDFVKGLAGAVLFVVMGGAFFAGTAVGPSTNAPSVPVESPCTSGFDLNTISEHVPYRTCTSYPYVVFLDDEGQPVRAFDTSGPAEIPLSEVLGWFD